jgi:hypothetical protein
MQSAIEEVAAKVQEWRLTKKNRYERIPPYLVDEIKSLTPFTSESVLRQRFGLSRNFFVRRQTPSILGLAEQKYTKARTSFPDPVASSFVKVPSCLSHKPVHCELELPNGIKLRIY